MTERRSARSAFREEPPLVYVYEGNSERLATTTELELLAELVRASDEKDEIERLLREEWWLNHGHPFHALYGDDGEMACNACPADFKREPFDSLREKVRAARLERAASVAREEASK